MWIPDFILKMIGRQIADKIDLKEGNMDSSKKWYQSKGVWTGVVTFLIGAYAGFGATVAPAVGWHLPAIPEWLLTILGAVGVYSRVTATDKIG